LVRFDGKTGKPDKSWPLFGQVGNVVEYAVGPDGMLYLMAGPLGHGAFIYRLDRAGKYVPFPEGSDAIPVAEALTKSPKGKYPTWHLFPGNAYNEGTLPKVLFTGMKGHSNTHEKGFGVSPTGWIVAVVEGLYEDRYARLKTTKDGKLPRVVQVWSPDGKLQPVGVAGKNDLSGYNGHGAHMDRDGSIYLVRSFTLPRGTLKLDGIADVPVRLRRWGGHGTLIKFRGLGGKFPLGEFGEGDGPAGAVKLGSGFGDNGKMKPIYASGAQWAYGGMTGHLVGTCSCPHARHDMDGYTRSWIPAQHLSSIMVIDANGNRIARLGRYGNVDDTTADIEEDRDGLRFALPKAVAASDTAMYVVDYDNRRVMKAKLGYHAEETVGLDGSASVSTPAPVATATVAPKVSATSVPAAPAATPPTAAPAPSARSPEQVCRGWWSLAMSYKRAGRKDKARDYLQKIIDEHPKNDYAARAKREIARL